jgi:type III pantothenate kinase
MDAAPFLLIDSGNSRIKWAFADSCGTLGETDMLPHYMDTSLAAAGTSAMPELPWARLSPSCPAPHSIWISNVAGARAALHIEALLHACWPEVPRHIITTQLNQCGVSNRYQTPAQLGSDRWAGLIAAHAAYPGEHLLIATCGTATSLESLRADGVFSGGLIAPGWTLMVQSLGQHTAQLPTLTAEQAHNLLKHIATPQGLASGTAYQAGNLEFQGFALETEASISRGCLLAQAGLIEQAWQTWSDFLQAPVRLILSGGAADAVTSALRIPHTRHDQLVLTGLGLIAADHLSRHLHKMPGSGTVATDCTMPNSCSRPDLP